MVASRYLVKMRRCQKQAGRWCKGGRGLGTRARQGLGSICAVVSNDTDSLTNGSPVQVSLDVEQNLTVALPVLLAVLSLQLPNATSISLEKLAGRILNALLCASHQDCFDIVFFAKLLDEDEESLVESFAEL